MCRSISRITACTLAGMDRYIRNKIYRSLIAKGEIGREARARAVIVDGHWGLVGPGDNGADFGI